MVAGKEQLIKFQKRWQVLLYSEILLYTFGVFFFTYFMALNIAISLLITFLFVVFLMFFKSPWSRDINKTVNYIDANFKEASFSSGLLLVSEDQLSSLSKLQKHRISQQLQSKLKNTLPPNNIKTAFLVMVLLIGLGFIGYKFELFEGVKFSEEKIANKNKINFTPLDSIYKKDLNKPELIGQKINITYPSYANVPTITINNPNIKALENSRISWQLEFKGEVSEVVLELMGNTYLLESKNERYYTTGFTLEASGFYNFRFKDKENRAYVSGLYSLEAIEDEAPLVEIIGIPQYTYFDFGDDKQINFQTSIKDDYGIADAYIIATVSKGSGESVKFREEKIGFDTKITKGAKNLQLSKKIVLDDLKMEVGDELYFYVEALDKKQPKVNIARSETYFAVIKDTTTTQFSVEGTLGVDQMPDYFRSQRQLIIDTEKLIKDKPKLKVEDFKSKSNELGFDQKALRLKYGRFMGDESEMVIAPDENVLEESKDDTETHDNENMLAGYTHDHDGSNEEHLVPEKEEEKNDPLHEYLHNHDDPEESTLFEESLKTKLRKALDIMWDAELHLRLYEPEKSVPYQYKALKLIQEIKNSARIYVHRIGFDPPPIKEDRRLTGDIKKIKDFQKNESTTFEQSFPFIRKAIEKLESFSDENTVITISDQELFNAAGNELAARAIAEPGKYLTTLQKLKWITENTEHTIEEYRALQKSLLAVLPKVGKNPSSEGIFQEKINSLFLKELNAYE